MQFTLKRKFVTATLTATITLLFLTNNVYAHTITVPTSAYFGFGTGNYINFGVEKSFDTIYRENNYWYFDDYGFQVQDANMTINKLYEAAELTFTLSAPTNTTSTAKVVVPAFLGKPTRVDFNGVAQTEGEGWTWNDETLTVTVSPTHSSDVIVTIYFSTGQAPSTPPSTPPYQEHPVEQPPYTPPMLPKPEVEFQYGIIVAVGVIVALLVFVGASGRQKRSWKDSKTDFAKKWKKKTRRKYAS